jgi:uncharacterized membrane protein (UPF0136 family)
VPVAAPECRAVGARKVVPVLLVVLLVVLVPVVMRVIG